MPGYTQGPNRPNFWRNGFQWLWAKRLRHLFGICHFVLENLQMPHGGDGRSYKTAADPGEGPGALETSPPAPTRPDVSFWDWNSYIDRIVYHFLTGCFFFNKTRVELCSLHFAIKLKCNCFLWTLPWCVNSKVWVYNQISHLYRIRFMPLFL